MYSHPENVPELELNIIPRTDELAIAIKAFDWDYINPLLGTELIPIKSTLALELLELAVLEKNFSQITILLGLGIRIPKPVIFSCNIGDKYDVLNVKNQWLEAEVIAIEKHSVTVEFIGLPSKWNEVINVKTSSNRFSPLGIRSSGAVPVELERINWSVLFEGLFLHANTTTDWDFVIAHFSEIIDNRLEYIEELLSVALSTAATDQQIETILETDEKSFNEKFCAKAASNARWNMVEEYLATHKPSNDLLYVLVEWSFRKSNFLKAKEMFGLNEKIEIHPSLKLKHVHVKTLAMANSLDEWRFVCKYLDKFKTRKINYSEGVNLIEYALNTSANDEIILTLVKLGFPINLAILDCANKTKKFKWIMQLNDQEREKIVDIANFDHDLIVNALLQLNSHGKKLHNRIASLLDHSISRNDLQAVINSTKFGIKLHDINYEFMSVSTSKKHDSLESYYFLKRCFNEIYLDTLAKASTPEEWGFVCESIKLLKFLERGSATKILNAAITTKANEKTILFLLETNPEITVTTIKLAIKNKNTNWIHQLDLEKFESYLVNFTQINQWEGLKILYNLRPITLSDSIKEKILVNALLHYSISGLILCEELGINFEGNFDWDMHIPIVGINDSTYTGRIFLYHTFLKASSSDVEFVVKHSHLLRLSLENKDVYYSALISQAIAANSNEKTLIKIANLAFPLTSVMLASCFASDNSLVLSVMLTEDRDVSNEDQFKKSVAKGKYSHVVTYLQLRTPSLSTLKNIFEIISGYEDIELAKTMLKSILVVVKNKSDLAKAIDEFCMESSKVSRFVFFLDPIYATEIFLKKTYKVAAAKFNYEVMFAVLQKYPLSDQNKIPKVAKLIEQLFQYCNRTLSAGIVKQSTQLPLISLFRPSSSSVDRDLHYKFLAAANFIYLKLTGEGSLSSIDKHELNKGELKSIVGEVRLTDELIQGERRTRL